jgi:hypothetical protein
MLNLASPGYGVKFRYRSAAKHRKVHPISAVGQGRQNRTRMLIPIRFLAPRLRFSRTKTRFSAVDSGIRDRGEAQPQALVVELETKARRQTWRQETLVARV